ncbi:catalase [Malacoplasma iowae]|uniref:catalase n=1 Tax=Malacoplasma iowae TaxID=2116 RepID=UPI002A18BE27|nr:catalase [Malacoplasma iowae]WPL38311.1 catalase [Malacoplasma iowae]
MNEYKKYKLTTADGQPVENDNSSITGNVRGKTYTFLEDKHLVEKLAHFVRERIPERVVHAKGAGAHGYFLCTRDMSKYTKAKLFTQLNKKTPLFIRFSTVGGEAGSADSARDPRGFAIKFYTEEGNYDLVGNNTPIFFLRDGIKFPDFIHTQKRDPKTHLKDPNMFWDFLSLTPESLHQVTILMSDRGTPMTYRHMHGFGSHAFMWYTDEKNYVWVKYHIKSDQGIKNWVNESSIRMAGENPDFATQDLFEAIEKGDYPSWTVYVQIMNPSDVENFDYDPFDVTKVWYHSQYPLIEIGKIVLDKNPENYFAEVEQIAFSPARFVPGIYSSPDKMLQARLFSYEDAQRYRLGTNYQQIPVNIPKCACPYSNQRDGYMTVNGNYGSLPNYQPSTLKGASYVDDSDKVPQIDMNGVVKGRFNYPLEDVDFVQPGLLFDKVMDDAKRSRLIHNTASTLKLADVSIQYRWTALCYKASVNYGTMLANALGIDVNKVKSLSLMTEEERVKNTLPLNA